MHRSSVAAAACRTPSPTHTRHHLSVFRHYRLLLRIPLLLLCVPLLLLLIEVLLPLPLV